VNGSLPHRAERFIAVAILSVIAPFAVVMSAVLLTDWDRSSFYGDVCYILFVVAEWPLSLVHLFLPGDPPALISLLLCIISGLIWGSVVDLFFVLRKRHVA
jgi:hypothetical protein